MADDTKAALENLLAKYESVCQVFEAYKGTCEATLLRAAAKDETYRQAYQMMLAALHAGETAKVIGFLQSELADMESDGDGPPN